jgi:hypothetical protein
MHMRNMFSQSAVIAARLISSRKTCAWRASGLGPNIRALSFQGLNGPDVLADGKREYRADLPRKVCGRIVQTVDVAGTCNP